MDNSLLAELEWDEGRLTYRGIRYLLIRPETVVGFQKEAAGRLGGAAGEMMFAGGRLGGSLTARAWREQMGRTAGEVAAAMARMGGELGWARLSVEQLDLEAGRLTVRAEDSAFAAAHGPAPDGVCHLLRGVFAGVAEEIFGSPVEAREVECAARGDPCCRFVCQVR